MADLPFTLNFFKKIELYQDLVEIEGSNKDIWVAEKILLRWIVGMDYQHIGGVIGEDTAKHILKNECPGHSEHPKRVLDALTVHQFATNSDSSVPQNIRINLTARGYLAGKILDETNGLMNNRKYTCWVTTWWIIFSFGLILLLADTLKALIDLVMLLKK